MRINVKVNKDNEKHYIIAIEGNKLLYGGQNDAVFQKVCQHMPTAVLSLDTFNQGPNLLHDAHRRDQVHLRSYLPSPCQRRQCFGQIGPRQKGPTVCK